MSARRFPKGVVWATQLVAAAAVWVSFTAGGCSSSDNGGGSDSGTGGDHSVTVDSGGGADQTVADSGHPDGTSEANPCTGGQTSCNGSCVDLTSDTNNCGACNAKCGSGLVCSKGACSIVCGSGTTQCGAGCYDLQTDSNNCGSCGTKCTGSQVCNAGQCTTACGPGSTLCGASCVNTTSDNANCGSCGTICAAGTVCGGGHCSITCPGTETACVSGGGDGGAGTGVCTDTKSDVNNCGQCGNVCGQGLVCNGGTCALTCTTGLVNCNGACIDPKTNSQFCGAAGACAADAGSAGTACTNGQTCVNGTCSLTCPTGQVICGGKCVDPSNNNQFCGATAGCGVGGQGSAGSACTGGAVCSQGKCSANCATGLVLCNGICIDPQTNAQFCGATGTCSGPSAGTACPSGEVCASGQCQLTCQAGFINCGGKCINPLTDTTYCGASANCGAGDQGVKCPVGYVCSNAQCQISCTAGFIACGTAPNQVCINPLVDPVYCGAAGSCSVANTAGPPPASPNNSGNANSQGQNCSATPGYVCNGSGQCSLSCPPTSPVKCGTICVNPNSDPNHCGASGTCSAAPGPVSANDVPSGNSYSTANFAGYTCGAAPTTGFGTGWVCDGTGHCQLECPTASQVVCPEPSSSPPNNVPTCIDPTSSPTNCGASGPSNTVNGVINGCGVTSGSKGHNCATDFGVGYQCVNSTCQLVCQSGQAKCMVNGIATCVDPATSPTNCGATPGGACNVAPIGANPPNTAPTNGGDPNYQGEKCPALTQCGANTLGGGALYVCDSTCTANQIPCPAGAPPYCANYKTDNANCGSCGTACNTAANPLTTCGLKTGAPNGYGCNSTCATGQTTCPGASPPGTAYCADLSVDTNNCGTTVANGCGHKCPTGNVCSNGTCTNTCQSPDSLCTQTGTPYCANLSNSNSNCGTCGTACGGTCLPTGGSPPGQCCPAGSTLVCGGTCINGDSDVNNCGSCGHKCAGGQVCQQGGCQTLFCTTYKWGVGSTNGGATPSPFTCPSGATQWCYPSPISATDPAQAAQACSTCYNATCGLSNGDCAGNGYALTANSSGPTFGYVGGGCSSEPAGRVWFYSSSYEYYGTWAP